MIGTAAVAGVVAQERVALMQEAVNTTLGAQMQQLVSVEEEAAVRLAMVEPLFTLAAMVAVVLY